MASVQQALADAQAENKKRFQKEKEDALMAAKEDWKKETESRIIEVNSLTNQYSSLNMIYRYVGSKVSTSGA